MERKRAKIQADAPSRAYPLWVAIFIILFTVILTLAAFFLCRGVSGTGDMFADPVTASLLGVPTKDSVPAADAVSGEGGNERCFSRVVVDPGHGGEDGGAQSRSGLFEKDVNLSVSLYLRDLLEAAGVPVVMTRTEDKLLYDRTVDFKGRKKALDLAARLSIARSVPDSLLVSVHMNAFPQTQYSGMQVWYAPADLHSGDIARCVQSRSLWLDPGNRRRVKAAGQNIYLLHNLDTPAILVEGGFLSNPEEALHLGDAEYQKKLAFVIFSGIMEAADHSQYRAECFGHG